MSSCGVWLMLTLCVNVWYSHNNKEIMQWHILSTVNCFESHRYIKLFILLECCEWCKRRMKQLTSNELLNCTFITFLHHYQHSRYFDELGLLILVPKEMRIFEFYFIIMFQFTAFISELKVTWIFVCGYLQYFLRNLMWKKSVSFWQRYNKLCLWACSCWLTVWYACVLLC